MEQTIIKVVQVRDIGPVPGHITTHLKAKAAQIQIKYFLFFY